MLDIFATPDGLKRAIIALLVRLSTADGKFDPREGAYILEIASQLGLEEETVVEIAGNPSTYKLKPPADEQSRMTILYYLLFLMDVDGEITQEEVDLMQIMGFRLGIRTELTRDLITILKAHSQQGVAPHKMLEKVKAYLN